MIMLTVGAICTSLMIIAFIAMTPSMEERVQKPRQNKWPWGINNSELKNAMVSALDKIIEEGTESSYVHISFDDEYYIQYLYFREAQEVLCVAVSNKNLTSSYKISPIQEALLVKMGYLEPGRTDSHGNSFSNFSKWCSVREHEDFPLICDELLKIIEGSYGIKQGVNVSLKVVL